MADSSPSSEGLFLKHFTRGKQLYDSGSLEEAARELEEAYLLRPRDLKVLNLLGLIYFKQEKLEKAEEVYRKLVTENPESHTLFYNLGLIHFKMNRLEEAELAFLKALELNRENPKINFYLGSIYERLRRFQDAIYQYRQAGANIMVRRVEDKLAPVRHAPEPKRRQPTDTEEFSIADVKAAAAAAAPKTEPFITPKTIGPVSGSLMADAAAPRRTDETARFQVTETQPPGAAPATPGSDIVTVLARLPMTSPPHRPGVTGVFRAVPPEQLVRPERPAPVPPKPSDVFRQLEKNLIEINFSGKVFIKQGTIYSYSGNLTFWVKEKRPGGSPALVIITGTGKLILTDKDREISLMPVEQHPLYVEPAHLLACEETVAPRYMSVGGSGSGPEFLVLEGRGLAALSVASKPLTLSVTPDLPVSVPASSVISWTGTLTPRLVEDQQLFAVMSPGGAAASLIRLEGTGRVLVEQVR
jgi:uncharacterized protein (AIM24 family)